MSGESRELVTWVLGTLLSISIIAGLLVRFVLVPYLRDHLVEPMKTVRRQMTVNKHVSEVPTMLDRIDTLQDSMDEIKTGLEASNERFDQHLGWSHEEANRLWHAIVTRYTGPDWDRGRDGRGDE